jgi:uncharacterized protein (DUF58 family)
MRPTSFFLSLMLAWTAFGLLASVWPQVLGLLWLFCGIVLTIAAGIDISSLPKTRHLHLQRQLPARFALGSPAPVALTVSHDLKRSLTVELIDGLPTTAEAPTLPWNGQLPPGETATLTYDLHFTQRGPQTLAPAHLLACSRLNLWQRALRIGDSTVTRCYPNYEPIVRYALLAMANRQEQMGIVKRRRTGATLDFHQLREYQDGDVLSRVDWKATSRRGALISRDYEEQRNQTLILVPDCGRRMRALDGELSQFDHCLNAMLLLSYIALRQGDDVGILPFGGEARWLKPVKGAHAMPIILNHLYDYQTTTQPSDFTEAAQRIMALQKRRALVIFLTNLRTEDSTHLHAAVDLLRHRHLVLLASLREQELDHRANSPIEDLDSALGYGALCAYFQERDLLLRTLRAHRIHTLDATAQSLPIALTNRYLDLKGTGSL